MRPSADPKPGPGNSRLSRFLFVERFSHWFYATLFIGAFVSGLLTWVPATRVWLAGARQSVVLYHGIAGFAMLGVPLLVLLALDRRRLSRGLREVDLWDEDDRRWIWAALRGRSLRGGPMPPQGRLNAGQKLNTILVGAMAVGFVFTGSLLLAKPHLPAWLVSRALWLHGLLAAAGILLLAGHLGHVLLTRHGRDYLEAMIRGTLSEQTARDRHFKWWSSTGSATTPRDRPDGEARDDRVDSGGSGQIV